jgi:predicted RNase H-like HicB family nuclease
MASYIAIVQRDGEAGYTASFPDFPGCAVGALTVDHVIAKAREALLTHVERLLEANQRICSPTAAEAIELGDALLLAAVDVPDDLQISHIDLAIPALSLARIDSFARRHGLTHAALFVEAVNRWAMEETLLRERRGGISDGPTLFDCGNPLELRVQPIAAVTEPQNDTAANESEASEETIIQCNVDAITAELVRLLEDRSDPQPIDSPTEPTDSPVQDERNGEVRPAE